MTPESLGAGSEATVSVQGQRQGFWLFDPDQQLLGLSVRRGLEQLPLQLSEEGQSGQSWFRSV